MQMQAAVLRTVHEPLAIESVDVDKPSGHEVLVRTVATGVCHSDLHVADGLSRYSLDRPIVLGHEGAGIVLAVGEAVTTVRRSDHVVACLSGFCGTCAQCLGGHPNSRMGVNQFRVDIPRYLEFYRQGRLMLDEMITRAGRLDDINDAFRAMTAGEVARTVLMFD